LSFPKIIFRGSLVLFAIIGIFAAFKKLSHGSVSSVVKAEVKTPALEVKTSKLPDISSEPFHVGGDFPDIDRVYQLFTTGPSKLPIVETISYTSSVSWLKGRPAWIGDYASYYGTSKHFIARSLNGKPDYENQKVSPDCKFNVFRKDRNFQFYLLVDVSLCKMGFYYIDLDTQERVLLKTYKVGLGKLTAAGSSTPLGKYTLGSKVAVYKPGVMGLYRDKQIEMMRVFGTRWIPLEQGSEVKGYGIHGTPWEVDSKLNQLIDNRSGIGKYESQGSIYLGTDDMEELFAIVISKPALIEVVRHFKDAKLPGVEVASPMR
jgi:hypothetical protein